MKRTKQLKTARLKDAADRKRTRQALAAERDALRREVRGVVPMGHDSGWPADKGE